MKLTKVQKMLAAGVALVVIAGGGSYGFTQYQEAKVQAAEAKKAQEELDKATKAVKTAEKSVTKDDIDTATKLVDKLDDKENKDKLTKRLEAVSKALAVKEQTEKATKAVKSAEDNQSRENVATAQAEVDKVTDADKKAKLQARLDAVSNALTAKEAEANKAAAEQAAASEAQAQAEAQASSANASGTATYTSSGQTYTVSGNSEYPGANNTGGQGQPAGYGVAQYGTSDWEAQRQAQADQNTVWNQQASVADYSWAATAQ